MSARNVLRRWAAALQDGDKVDMSSDLNLIPNADNEGALIIGDGTNDADFKVFLGATTDYALFDVSAGKLEMTAAEIDMNGNEFILDADADTSITADTDDQIDIKVGGTDVVAVYPNGLQDHGVQAVTATTDGTGTGLITQGAKHVTVTSDTATNQISLPAATVGDIINILVTGEACEMISAVPAHQVNGVTVGATNELALVENSLYRCHYVAANNWIVTGVTSLGADEAALVPDIL